MISGLLAVISAFFIPPDAAYLSYIDFHVLALLYCLMSVSYTHLDVYKRQIDKGRLRFGMFQNGDRNNDCLLYTSTVSAHTAAKASAV